MKRFLVIFSALMAFSLNTVNVLAQMKESEFSKITFDSKENDSARTYIGKLKKGDLSSLKYELQRYNSGVKNEVDVDNDKASLQGYVDRIAIVGEKKKNKDKLNKAAQEDLLGNYEVKDQESLLEIKVKKIKEVEAKAFEKDDNGNYMKYNTARKKKNNPGLSKFYKISTGRRLRNGQTFSRPSGGVALIITYKVREGRTISTYVNVVEGYLSPGSNYNLKFHGTGSNRKYYLEFVSVVK